MAVENVAFDRKHLNISLAEFRHERRSSTSQLGWINEKPYISSPCYETYYGARLCNSLRSAESV